MHALRFQNQFTIVLLNFTIASAILLSAYTPVICAQDPPRVSSRPILAAGTAKTTGSSDISNNVGSVKSFLSALLRSLRRVVFLVLL